MAERKQKATKEESLKAKILKNAEAIAAQEAKLDALKAVEAELKSQAWWSPQRGKESREKGAEGGRE